MHSFWRRLLRFILVLLPVTFVAFVGFVFFLLVGLQAEFYVYLYIASFFAVVIGIGLWVFRVATARIRWWGLGVMTAILLVSVGVFEVQSYRVDQLATVSEADVEVEQFQPFTNDGTLATLDHTASLQLEDDLPIMDGATALYPVYAAFAQEVYPEVIYDPDVSAVRRTQTGQAISDLTHGEADIIFTSAPSQSQLDEAEEMDVSFNLTPIGKEAFVFFVNQENEVDSLTTEQIQAIYAGEVTNWREVSEGSGSIQAFQRPEGSGSQSALESFMGERDIMEPPSEDRIGGMGGIIDETSDYRNHANAIGYSFRFFATEMTDVDGIKLLAVDGVEPTRENIEQGTYPLTSEFYAITREGEESEHTLQLLDWIVSEEGQQIISDTGYVPIGND